MDYSVIAFKIINIILGINKRDVVSISGEIHNGKSSDKKVGSILSEIPFIEELALAIRKKKAFPVLELSTERLTQRFLEEVPDDVYDLSFDYYAKWTETIDCFIDVGWRSNPDIFNRISDYKYEKIVDSTASISSIIYKQNKKMLFLGFPTKALADFYKIDLFLLVDTYFNSLNCDYKVLADLYEELYFELIDSSEIDVFTCKNSYDPDKNIDSLRLQLNSLTVNKGIFDNEIIYLPAGRIEIATRPDELNGIFYADQVYYLNEVFNDVEIYFNNGVVNSVRFAKQVSGISKIQSALMNCKKQHYLIIGFNPNVLKPIGYYLFDQNVKNSVSIKLFDSKDNEIIVMSRKGKVLNKDKKNILSEVLDG